MHRLRVWGDADTPLSAYRDKLRGTHYPWVHGLFRFQVLNCLGPMVSPWEFWLSPETLCPDPTLCYHPNAGNLAINYQDCWDSRTSLLWDLQKFLSQLPNQLGKAFHYGERCKWVLFSHFFFCLFFQTVSSHHLIFDDILPVLKNLIFWERKEI